MGVRLRPLFLCITFEVMCFDKLFLHRITEFTLAKKTNQAVHGFNSLARKVDTQGKSGAAE
jgi:hypothetical protein